MINICIDKEAPEIEDESFPLPQQPAYHKLISNVYKNKIFYVKQFVNGDITHILPFALVSNPIFGKKIVSMPYDGSYGDVIKLKNIDISNDFYDRLISFARRNNVKYVEIRSRQENEQLERLGFVKSVNLVISEITLNDIYNSNKFMRKRRSDLNYTSNHGVNISISNSRKDIRMFYKIMSLNMRSYGTPMYPYKYFKQLWINYKNSDKMLLIKGTFEGKMISGLLLLLSGKTAIMKYTATLEKHIHKKVYPSMKWFVMDFCRQNQYEIFNLGTSFADDYGLITYKERMGSESIPLISYSLNLYSKNKSLSHYQNKYGIFIKLWKWQPLCLSQWLGGIFWKWFC